MLGTLFDSGITGVRTRHVFLAVQQFGDLGDVGDIGRRYYHAVHQPRFFVGTNVGFRAKVVLVSLLGVVHFRVALAVLILGRARRLDQRGIDDGALA